MVFNRCIAFLMVLVVALECSGGGKGSPNITTVPTPTRVDVEPSSTSIVVGSTRQLSATVYDQNNAVMAGLSITWSSSSLAVATVSTGGVVSAVAAGSATIAASISGVSGTSSIAVTGPPTVTRVQVTPASAAIDIGSSTTLTANAYDAQNVVITGRIVNFSSSNTTVATVSAAGAVTGNAAGSATISATIDGVAGTSVVTVRPPNSGGVVQSVVIQPAPLSVLVGGTATLLALPKDAQGNVITGKTATWSSATTSVATVDQAGVLTSVSVGVTVITATVDGVSGTATVSVVPLPSGNVIDVNTSQTFQTISGWDTNAGLGENDCNPTAYALFKGPIIDRGANELGITRVRLGLRSGLESPVDYFAQYQAGLIDYPTWESHWFLPANDDANPNSANPAGFQWSYLDFKIDEIVVPLMQKLQARGDKLYVILNYIDFAKGAVKTFIHIKQPNEYAEFVVAAVQHIQQKYGWSPDAIDVLLEPQNVGGSNTTVTGADLGAATVAVGNRLASLGFHPDFIAPSDASMAGSVTYYDQMIQTPGVMTYLKELSYHRYQGVSLASLQAIAFRGQRDHVRTSMNEWTQSDIDTLIEDLTVGNNSAWEQYSLGYCGSGTNPGASGIYYQVNQSTPTNPIITMTYDARDYRQIFAYARPGAVRIGATSGNAALLSPVAFRNANGKHVVVVRTQSAAAFSLQGLPSGTYGVNFNSLTQNGVNLQDIAVTPTGILSSSTPSKGVITFYQR